MSRNGLVLLLILGLTTSLLAETSFGLRRFTGIPFFDANQNRIPFPFLGGQDQTLHQLVDIDGDGDLDLFIQIDFNRVHYFENRGNSHAPDFVWNPSFGGSLNMGGWFYFADMDGDGDYDLVGALRADMLSVKLNQGGPKNPHFEDTVRTLMSETDTPVRIHLLEDMDFADIDCDGDLDLFAATVLGVIRYYENTGILKNGLPVFKEPIGEYQGFKFVPHFSANAKLAATKGPEGNQHGSLSTLTWVDIDKDGDLDMAYGDYYDSGMVMVINSGSCKVPHYESPVAMAEPGVINTGGGNLARFGDLDGDGTTDLILSNLSGARSVERGQKCSLNYFRNVGKPPKWKFEKDSVDMIASVDVGVSSMVRFVDIDGDGDRDLFMTNEIDSGMITHSALFFYRNTGSANDPAYVYQSQAFLRLQVEYDISLTFGDLDGDGDPDLITGNETGTLAYYENRGTSKSPDFHLVDSTYLEVDAGVRSTPILGDLDGDGDLDLLIGESRDPVQFYRNDGTAQKAQFSLEKNELQGIQGPIGARLSLGDLDGDGDLDLVVGGVEKTAQIWINSGTRTKPLFTIAIAIESPTGLTPELFDFDQDGDLDLFGGCRAGGLILYENTGVLPYVSVNPSRLGKHLISPSPYGKSANNNWRIVIPGKGNFDIKGSVRPRNKFK